MPSVHSIPFTNRPSPVSQSNFAFPADRHLLITTPSHILSWDSAGLHTLFQSSRSGIAAATESKDGSGTLAIADKHVVVLHDTRRGKEKSWGLSAEEDEVRHLEYTNDSKSLFLSTKATNSIQCYSTQTQQLLNPPQTLASPPAAMAVSPTGHLMISAQGAPPVVFLKDLASNSPATLLKPQSSTAGVTLAAFHPERTNIFLLAFEDGTLAVFDASRLSRSAGEGRYVDQAHMGRAELGRKRQLHRPVHAKAGGGLHSITGAAFLPGHKRRTITVGMDGRCHLVDFSIGVNVLRTWHGKAPLTSVSVLAPSSSAQDSRKGKASVRSCDSGGIIAVGSYDGNVDLYDFVGVTQGHQEISSTGQRIISVEWITAPSPKSLSTPERKDTITNADVTRDLPEDTKTDQPKGSTPNHLKVHPALRPPPKKSHSILSPYQSRKFTIHPDEALDDSTVRHTPTGKEKHAISAEAEAYLDLFSPVNPFAVQQSRQNRDQSFSPMRTRPRISSQTFVTDAKATKTVSSPPKPLLAPESHATSSDTTHPTATGVSVVPKIPGRSPLRPSPLKTERRRANLRSVHKRMPVRSESVENVDATAAANARLLRDLRQMSMKSATPSSGSVLQGYASTSNRKSQRRPGVEQLGDQRKVMQKASEPAQAPVATHVYGPEGRWPTDSIDQSSSSDWQEDDIWITSDEERKNSSRRHRLFPRPAARQTSRSRMNSKGTISTTQSAAPDPAPVEALGASNANAGMSTEDYATANSQQLSPPNAAFSLASDDVQSIFPRTSSVSPRRKSKGVDRQSRQSPRHRKTALQEIASNAAAGRRSSDPWTRMKQAKSSPAKSDKAEGPAPASDDGVDARPPARADSCGGCATNAGRVRVLEGEVAHMKGEILALRAMLRRNGIPAPAVPRR